MSKTKNKFKQEKSLNKVKDSYMANSVNNEDKFYARLEDSRQKITKTVRELGSQQFGPLLAQAHNLRISESLGALTRTSLFSPHLLSGRYHGQPTYLSSSVSSSLSSSLSGRVVSASETSTVAVVPPPETLPMATPQNLAIPSQGHPATRPPCQPSSQAHSARLSASSFQIGRYLYPLLYIYLLCCAIMLSAQKDVYSTTQRSLDLFPTQSLLAYLFYLSLPSSTFSISLLTVCGLS